MSFDRRVGGAVPGMGQLARCVLGIVPGHEMRHVRIEVNDAITKAKQTEALQEQVTESRPKRIAYRIRFRQEAGFRNSIFKLGCQAQLN